MQIDFNKIRLFKWGELHYEEFETNIGIDALILLNENQENTFNQLKVKLIKDIKEDKNLQFINSEYFASYYQHMYEIEEITLDKLKLHQRYAILLSVFSFFEGRLKSISEKIEHHFEFKIKIDDLNSNNHVLKYWNYLLKVYELNIEKIEPYFTPIKQQTIVRNIIAHQEGYLKGGEQKKITIVPGLLLKEFGSITQIEITNTEYFSNLVKKIKSFFKELILAIDDRYIELKK